MSRAVLIALVATALAAGPALADKKIRQDEDKKERNAARKKKETQSAVKEKSESRLFYSRHRGYARKYYVDTYGRGKCPPGLAKKGYGCLPPGIAAKRYYIGQPLAPAIILEPVPYGLARQLGPAPVGYKYGIVDGDVVMLAAGTLVVVDAIDPWLD